VRLHPPGPRIRVMRPLHARIPIILSLICVSGASLWAQPAVAPEQFGGLAPKQSATQRPVYIEDSPAAQELADEALDLAKQGRTADAAQKLQRVMDEYPFKLMPNGEGSFTDAVLWVRSRLLADEALLGVYRSLFGPAASREISLAMPTATQPIDTQKLRDVLTRHTLTRAGLDAGLALGAYHLERAEGRDASGVLDELIDHPDLPEHRGRYHFQRALAARLFSDEAAYETHRQALQALADTSYLNELEEFTRRANPSLRIQLSTEDTSTAESTLPQSFDQPLWEEEYIHEYMDALINHPGLRGVPAGQSLLRVLPGVDEQRVYINLGDRVTGFDLASGWRLWEMEDAPSSNVYPGQAITRRIMTEPRGVFVSSGRVFSLIGWVDPRQNLPAGTRQGVSLVSIDSSEGNELWRIKPWELDRALEKASFDGTPIGGDGRVYILVKRVQVSGLHDLYLTAVSADDGRLLWRRHIASSSTDGNYNTGPLARMLLHHGVVYVTDNRGTVCALDGRIGTVRWLTILPGDGLVNPTGRRVVIPVKDIPPPIIVKAGLIVPPPLGGQTHMLLDTQTGLVQRDLKEGDWKNVLSCYQAGPDVLALGDGVSVFDGETLQRLWNTPLDNAIYGVPRGRPAVDLRMGPPSDSVATDNQPTGGVAVLHTDRRFVSLSLADGRILGDAPSETPGNIVLASGQVLVASSQSLQGFTDWSVAHAQITQRASQDPSDPQPGLALARLALRTGRDQGVLEGIDLALASLSEPSAENLEQDARRRMVIQPIREIIDPASGAGLELRGELLDRLAASASTPEQEAAYQLVRGLYLEETGQPQRAVEHYQAVLADRSLSAQLFSYGRGSVRAGLEAQRLLKALIKTHGRAVYTNYDLLAEHELNELITQGESLAERYTVLADRYPLAVSANNARLYAADLYEQSGDVMASLRQLQTVYLSTDSIDRVSNAAGRIAQMYQDEGRPDLARRWLRRVRREYEGITLYRDEQPVSVPSWLSELSVQLAASRALPRLQLPLTQTQLIPGKPLPVAATSQPIPRDRILMRDDVSVWLMDARNMQPLWTIPLPATDMQVLAMDERQVIWWSIESGLLGGLDARTGQPLWPDIDFSLALEETGESNRHQQKRTHPQIQFAQILGGTNVRHRRAAPGDTSPNTLLNEVDLTTVILADLLGRIVCIDRHTGAVRWRRVSPSDNLTALSLGDGLVAISGASWADTQVQHGVITLLDSLTGEQLETQIQTDQVPAQLAFADDGQLLVVGNNKLSAYDATSGRTRWTHSLPRQTTFRRVWIGDRLLIASTYQAQVGSALVMELESGSVINQLPIRMVVGQPHSFNVIVDENRWQVFSPMQAMALDTAGRTLWADAISTPIGQMLMQEVGEQHVVLISKTRSHQIPKIPPGNFPNRAQMEKALDDAGLLRVKQGGYRLYLLNRETGLILSDTPLGETPAPIDPTASVLLDGALLLGAGDQTLLIRSQNRPD